MLSAILKDFVTSGMLVFDIGANAGYFAREVTALGAQVVSVEPDRKHIDALNIPGVTPIIAAVGAEHGTANFYLSHNDKWSSLHPEWVTGHYGKPDPDTRLTEVITLDMMIGEFGQPDFIKIDTEGNEAAVLRGLSYTVPALSFEYHGGAYPVKLNNDPLYECFTLLPDYEFRAAQHESHWVTDWVSADDMMTLMRDLTWGDVYARHAQG